MWTRRCDISKMPVSELRFSYNKTVIFKDLTNSQTTGQLQLVYTGSLEQTAKI